MLTKLATFRGVSPEGEPLARIFRPGDSIVKVAGEMMPQIREWLNGYKSDSNKIAVLVNALGASEYFGQNVNGDLFPENALVHDCRSHPSDQHPIDDFTGKIVPPYGYWTFLQALPYCFPAGTQIVCGDRIRRPIEEIEIGDFVATSDGPKAVSRIMKRSYTGHGISLKLRGEFESLIGTEEHPVLAYKREQIHCPCKYSRIGFSDHSRDCVAFRKPIGDPEWIPLNDILPGDYLVLPQPQHGEEKISPHFAELVGWVASEGHLGSKGNIQFCFSENNESDLCSVQNCLEANGLHVTVTPRPQYGLTMLTSCNSEIYSELASYVKGIKSEKYITSKILKWDQDSLLKMLGAYIDGDGHIPKKGRNKGQLRIRSSSPQMLRILSDIIRSLGIPTTVQWDNELTEMLSPTNGKIYPSNGSGVVTVAAGWAPEVSSYSRKHQSFEMGKDNRQKMIGKTFLVQVTERDDVDLDEDVFNLEIPGPHNYVAGEVLVHNCHHKNKDPNRAFGKVVVAVWNPRMHRVELVIVLDKQLALQNGAQHVTDRILAGEFPDVSMGAKVPYDICTCCSHKSKTRNDYCSCIRYIGMGKILDDGRRIGVINIHPRFFDISFVFIGADKTAKVMCKLASDSPESLWLPQSVFDADQIYKTACGAKDCRDCHGGCRVGKIKAASMDEAEATAALMSLVKPKKVYTRGPLEMPNNLAFVVDKEMKNLAKKAPQPRLYFGREDDQQREGKRAIVDGTLKTNSNTNECDEFPAPLTPSRGKTALASVGKETAMGALLGAAGAGTGAGVMALIRSKGRLSPKLLKSLLSVASEGAIGGGSAGALAESIRHTKKKRRSPIIRHIEHEHKHASAFKMEPPPSPNRKEFPFVGTIDFRGIKIGVENAPGTWRTGKGWKTLMKYPYGEFLANAMGHDKDKLDVYVGPNTDAPNVYIVHQNKVSGEDAGQYDEDKVMLGFRSTEEAKTAYLAHYNSDKFFRSITTMSFPLFKKALLREEFEGDKVAALKDMLEKNASDLRLEDLFSGTKLQRRERIWRDETTGKEVKVIGSGINKTASKRKVAAPSAHDLLKISAEKWADIVKEIGPEKAVGKVSPLLSSSEGTLPPEILDSMGSTGIGQGLSTASLMGMVLKPEEFQRILLAAMGHSELANKMDNAGEVFSPQEGEAAPCEPLESNQFSPNMMSKLLPHLGDKSYFGPVVRRRILQIIISKPEERGESKEVNSPLLSKVGSAYNWYRREQMKLAGEAMRIVPSIPQLHASLYGLDEARLFDKTAGWLNPKTMAVLLGAIPLTLMYSAHQRRKEMKGEELGLLNQLIADHPWLATLGTSAALREILKTPQGQAAVDEVLAAGQRIWEGKKVPQPA